MRMRSDRATPRFFPELMASTESQSARPAARMGSGRALTAKVEQRAGGPLPGIVGVSRDARRTTELVEKTVWSFLQEFLSVNRYRVFK